MTKWYRVIDPLNPLCGCDVFGLEGSDDGGNTLALTKLRRVDVFAGDRPYQLNAPPGLRGLGITITNDTYNWTGVLVASAIQDEIVELATDRPFGRCLEEYQLDRADGVALRVASFENGIQVALDDVNGVLIRSIVFCGPDRDCDFDEIVFNFHDGLDTDELLDLMTEG